MKYQSRSIRGALYDKKRANKLLNDVVTVTYPDLELLSETLRGAGINGGFYRDYGLRIYR